MLEGSEIVHAWCGIEGVGEDDLPIIGLGRTEGLVHAFGFSGHGFAIAPAIGEMVAQLALDGRSNLSAAPFDPFRFA